MSTHELKHYGVKGMKWGVRRAKKFKDKAKEARKIGDTDLAKRYEQESKVHTKKAKFQKKQADVAKTRTMGHKVATNLLFGPFANRTYNSVRAAGGSRVKAVGITAGANLLGGPLGHIFIAHLYTEDAGRK